MKRLWEQVMSRGDESSSLPFSVLTTIEVYEAALRIAEKHGYNIYDALVVSAALQAGCTTHYSEHLHDSQIIDGQLTIRNLFAGSSG